MWIPGRYSMLIFCVCFAVRKIWMLCSHFLQLTVSRRTMIKQQNTGKRGTAASRTETILQLLCNTHRWKYIKENIATWKKNKTKHNCIPDDCNWHSKTKESPQLHLACLFSWQGVCAAPPGSEQLSLCYANRSAALFYLQHYQVSSFDFQKIDEMQSHVFNKLCNLQSFKLSSNFLWL